MAIYEKHGGDAVIEFYNKLNRVMIDLISKIGLTVGLKEYIPSEKMLKEKKKILDIYFKNTREIEQKFKNKTLKKIPGKSLRESFEKYMFEEGNKAKKEIEELIISEKISLLFGDKPHYNTLVMILSGARGKISNLTNIVGLWGQIAVREKRPTRGYNGRILPTYEVGDEGGLAKGFITKAFYEGMSAREVYFHAMGGRQGEVDTSVSTKVSGYLYRRISNATRDLIVLSDYSTRTADNKIIQFVYGDDKADPQKTYHGEVFFEQRLNDIYKKIMGE